MAKTGNTNTAKRVLRFLKELYQVDAQLSITKKMKPKKNSVHVIRVKNKAMEILRDLGIMTGRGLQSRLSNKTVHKECCARAYPADAFLAGGSMNPPGKFSCHLEISTRNMDLVKLIWELTQRFGPPTKQIRRRNQKVVYLKVSNKISDFLRCVGISDVVSAFGNSRIQRDFMSSLTWLDSCELANEMEDITAGKKQLEDIQWIEICRTLDSLPKELQYVVYARKQLPETSLNGLCEYCTEEFNETMSKSGMEYRLAKLRKPADQYRKE